jgi:hypothetical protein
VGKDKVLRQKEVDPSAFPLVLNSFESGPPGFVYETMGHPFRPGDELYSFIRYRKDELKKFAGPGEEVVIPTVITPVPYARLIAKIAHALAVAMIGYNAFEPYLPGVILGTDKRHFHFIGSKAVHEPDNAGLHQLSIRHGIPNMSLIGQPMDLVHVCAIVRLFCRFGMPEYLAIVGKLKGEFK